MAISAYILKIVEKDPFLRLQMRAKEMFNLGLGLQLHGPIYRPDFFVLMLHHCVNLKAVRYESTNLNRIAADKSPRVIVA